MKILHGIDDDRFNIVAVVRLRVEKGLLLEAPRLQAEVHGGRVEEAAEWGRVKAVASVFVAFKSANNNIKYLYPLWWWSSGLNNRLFIDMTEVRFPKFCPKVERMKKVRTCLEVIGGYSCPTGREFESRCRMQDGRFFTFIWCKIALLFEKTKDKQKESIDGPLKIFKQG